MPNQERHITSKQVIEQENSRQVSRRAFMRAIVGIPIPEIKKVSEQKNNKNQRIRQPFSRRTFILATVGSATAELVGGGLITWSVIEEVRKENNQKILDSCHRIMSDAANTASPISRQIGSILIDLNGDFADEKMRQELNDAILNEKYKNREERFKGLYAFYKSVITTRQAELTPSKGIRPLTGENTKRIAGIAAYAGSQWDKRNTLDTVAWLNEVDSHVGALESQHTVSITITQDKQTISGDPFTIFDTVLTSARENIIGE